MMMAVLVLVLLWHGCRSELWSDERCVELLTGVAQWYAATREEEQRRCSACE